MKKLKLQMQISVDGYVAGPNGELDWMMWDWDDEIKAYVDKLTSTMDTILLGRKMTDGFINHWSAATENPEDPSYPFAKIMMDTPKVVFSKTLNESRWYNTTLVNGDTNKFINDLKRKPGKDIIVYGGAGFVSSLVNDDLIDEYYLFVNPSAIGTGMEIFHKHQGKLDLQLTESKAFDCGIVLNHYTKRNATT